MNKPEITTWILASVFLIFLLICVVAKFKDKKSNVRPSTQKNEAYYQHIAAKQLGGKTEHILPDRTRIDILTDKESIEVDWASKWAEGIGQALYYSAMTTKEAGLILIMKSEKDERYIKRVQKIILIKSLKINLYVIGQDEKLKRVE